MSMGVKGARIGMGSRGPYISGGIPGTGIYGISHLGGKKARSNSTASTVSAEDYVKVLGGIGIVIAALVLFFISPILMILAAVAGIGGYIFYGRTPKQQAKKKIKEASKLFEQGNWAQVISKLREAEKLDPLQSNIPFLLGAALQNAGEHKTAVPYLEKYTQQNPDNLYVKVVLANCYLRMNQPDTAIKIIQSLPEEVQNTTNAIQVLGLSFAQKKQYDLAIDVYKRAPLRKRNLDDELKGIHYSLASVYEESGDQKNALKHYKRVYAEDMAYKQVAEKVEKLNKSE